MSNTSEKANHARIRDNQRRSRARRKEYLEELEVRLRQCGLKGIEASAEVQVAARRVADENKLLRALLAQNGIGHDAIEEHLQSASAKDISDPSRRGSAGVEVLEQLLQTRKCCSEDRTIDPTSSVTTAPDRRQSSSSQATTHLFQDPTARHIKRKLQPTTSSISSTDQIQTPSIRKGRIKCNSTHGNRESCATKKQCKDLSPALNNTKPVPHVISPGIRLPVSDTFVNETTTTDFDAKKAPGDSSGIPASKKLNTKKCGYATEIITTMSGRDPSVVRIELGCSPGVECDVDNQLVFDVMDRYSSTLL